MDEITEKEMQRILANLRVGIAKIETGGESDPYGSIAGDKNKDGKPDSSATGKYQFTKEWLSKKGGVQGIKEFAKSSGVFKEVSAMNDFASQPELQEAYFTYYAKKVLVPQALKTASKNPLNLSIDEIASQFHFQSPKIAKNSVQSGKLVKETSTNASGNKYIDLYRKGLNDFGLKPVTSNEVIKAKEQAAVDSGKEVVLSENEKKIKNNLKNIKDTFSKKDKAISSLDIDQGSKEKLRAELYQEAVNNGTVNVVNEYIEDENISQQNKLSEFNELLDFAKKISYKYDDESIKGNRKVFGDAIFVPWKDSDDEQVKKLNKKFNILSKSHHKGKHVINPEALFKTLNNQYNDLTGKDLNLDKDFAKGESFSLTKGSLGGLVDSLSDMLHGENTSFYGKMEGNIEPIRIKKRQPIDPKNYSKKSFEEIYEKKETETNVKKETQVNKSSGKSSKINAEINTPEGINDNAAEEFFQRQLGLHSVNGEDFNYGKTKQDLPIDAITGLALGLIGDKQAKDANIPLRTEEVSDAVKMFTAELAQRSKQGLPVEIEAKMRNDLAESFQAGLSNIVNTSAGNRATVLGNLGALDANKNKGNIAIQVADYEAKEKAFAQYGAALQYENDFNANRDIANHGIKYQEAKTKQIEGKQLAAAGFGKMMEALKHQKENGPGSANDMRRSQLMQSIFGFDPKMKDDGTGSVKGTKSYFDLKKTAKKGEKEGLENMYQKLGTMTPEGRKAIGEMTKQISDPKKIDKFMNHIIENPDFDASKVTMDNIDLAEKEGDYNYLAMDRNTGLQTQLKNGSKSMPIADKNGIISLSPENLKNDNPEFNVQESLNSYKADDKKNDGFGFPTIEDFSKEPEKPSLATNSYSAQLASMDEYYNNQ